MPIKTSVIDEEFEKLGLSLRAKNVGSRRKVLSDAYEAGQEAGRKFEVQAGIEWIQGAPVRVSAGPRRRRRPHELLAPEQRRRSTSQIIPASMWRVKE